MNGLINLYKPPSMSSAQVVAKVRRILGEKSVGHMGTLDPMAEGVLVLGVGKSTRLFEYLSGRKKSYIAKFKFGYETDTLDACGKVTETTCDIPSVDAIMHAMQSLVGKIEQVPPQYSAKHVNGKRAYAIARGGESAELKPVSVEIYGAELICQPSMSETVFSIDCSCGTYIRSICRDVARMCGSLATLTYLQRTASGCFSVRDSVSLEALEVRKASALVPPDSVLDIPKYVVPDDRYADLCYGRKLPCDRSGDVLVYCRSEFFGIGHAVDGVLKIKTYLKDEMS
ncbi:MAG: tRNA pseudouridine(55) synthase TruB [Roseburia sp.]|nr:tRNA pseudouridine(55) synthase TruB [Roseburia sp.]